MNSKYINSNEFIGKYMVLYMGLPPQFLDSITDSNEFIFKKKKKSNEFTYNADTSVTWG